MRFKNGLTIWERTSSRDVWNIAAHHPPHSMTWTWILSFGLPRRGEGRWFYFGYAPGQGQRWHLQFFKFSLHWHRQEPMWYRDLYNRLSEERAIASGMMWPGPAYVPPPPLPPITTSNTDTRH
jgi:hypothetical protein